ncbi:hypothetical protein [Dactylosporangium cerinum]
MYPQPRAVALDDEVHRILARIGLRDEFAAISRPHKGLRLLDRRMRVLAEFRRDGEHGGTATRKGACSTSPSWRRSSAAISSSTAA